MSNAGQICALSKHIIPKKGLRPRIEALRVLRYQILPIHRVRMQRNRTHRARMAKQGRLDKGAQGGKSYAYCSFWWWYRWSY